MTNRAKSIVKILAVVAILVLVASVVFVACGNKDNSEKSIVILVQHGEGFDSFELTTNKAFLADALEELKVQGKLTYTIDGTALTALNDLVTTSDWSKWIAVYHDIDDIALYFPDYDYEYSGRTFHSSSKGVLDCPLKNGATYLFLQN